MAERFVSPGVFTRENDLSFLPQGIAELGAGFVGPFLKGPAFKPVIVESANEFTATLPVVLPLEALTNVNLESRGVGPVGPI